MNQFESAPYREPVKVARCPNDHPNPVFAVSAVWKPREDIQIAPGAWTRNPAYLIGWNLSCGCLVLGEEYTLFVIEGRLPYFERNGS